MNKGYPECTPTCHSELDSESLKKNLLFLSEKTKRAKNENKKVE